MSLRDTVQKSPYKAGVVSAALFHSILRISSARRSSWVGSGGYFGLIGLLIPYLVEKKSPNATVQAFACGWRNCFVFMAIGENLFYITKTMQDKAQPENRSHPAIPVLISVGASVFLAFKAEAVKDYLPVQAPLASTDHGTGGSSHYKMVISGKKQYLIPTNDTSGKTKLTDGKGNVLYLVKN